MAKFALGPHPRMLDILNANPEVKKAYLGEGALL